ncbi:MAG: MarR family transcriptional regulator [Propionicimonas sp.]
MLVSAALRRVLAVLAEAPEPSSAAELAGRLGLHVTTVRSHLEQLERAGLATHQPDGGGRRGRPGFRYRATGRDPERARQEMIEVLAAALAAADGAADQLAMAAGRAWADQVDAAGAEPIAALTAAFAELGFDPEPEGGVIRLRGCPFRAAARAHPDVVCQVHLGLAQRLVERCDGGGRTVALQPFVAAELCVLTVAEAVPA